MSDPHDKRPRGRLRDRLAQKKQQQAQPQKRLTQLSPSQAGLGTTSIMDRTLAQQHGADYVYLAVFAIDIDRCLGAYPDEDPTHPFGWEVFLTACYVVGRIDGDAPAARELLEAACLHVLDGDPSEGPLGGQLVFAVHDALSRGYLHASLQDVFRTWRGGRKQLHRALDPLWADAPQWMARLALQCLSLPLEPPCAPPTLQTLEAMARGEFVLPTPRPPVDTQAEAADDTVGADAAVAVDADNGTSRE